MYYASRILGAASALGLAWSAWYSIRLARADADFRQAAPESVERAAGLTPRNTAYLALRALEVEYDGADPRPLLQRIAELNPLSSAPRIRLGLDAEVRGDSPAAERWLLDAARVDRQFEPAWTLANFYFRRRQLDPFWKWMRAALEMSYGDRRPAFDLCWRAAAGPEEILARAIPEQRETIGAYLDYLLERNRLNAAVPVARKLAAWYDPGDLEILERACDKLLDSGDGAAAAEIWTALGYAAPQGILHPDFEPPRLGHGFDWRRIESPGVTHLEEDAAHRILLSGEQPESCELLRQFADLHAGRRYALEWEARTSGFPENTGLEWRVGEEHTPVASSGGWTRQRFVFTVDKDWSPLSLVYQRPLGEARAEGWVEIRRVNLTTESAAP